MNNSIINNFVDGFIAFLFAISGPVAIMLSITSANNINSDEDFGQNNTMILDAMNEALSSGFSAEYQKMIRRYFNSMLKEGSEIKNNSMEKMTTNEPIK